MADSGTTLGQAYVQIIPSAKGITNAISNELGDGSSEGKKFGSGLISSFKSVIGAAAIGAFLKKAITVGAELEQNLGGTEAVYQEFASNLQNTAKEAYKNMGMSASEYMASANKMGSLLKGSGMDTEKAMNLVTTSMQRAADVASVMGISTESAMEAINGAAKGNFTMMDNLGVAMNATTLEAYAMSKGFKKAYKDMSNSEKTELAMQMFMERTQDMAGNFARESAETISGSFGSLKSAFNDFLGNLVTGADTTDALNAIIDSGINVAMNLGKAMMNIVKEIPSIAMDLVKKLGQSFPLDTIEELVSGLINNLPTLIDGLSSLVNRSLAFLMTKWPEFVAKGMEIVQSLISGLLSKLPDIIHSIYELVRSMLRTFYEHLPEFIQKGIEMVGKLIAGLIKSIPDLLKGVGQLLKEIWITFTSFNWKEIGKNIMEGIKNGIKNAISSVVNAAKEAASSIWKGITGFLGIHSPSRKGIWAGQMLDKGLALGIDANTGLVSKSVDKLNEELMPSINNDLVHSLSYDVSATRSSIERSQSYQTATDRFAQLLEDGKIVLMLDSEEVVGALSEKIDGALGQLQLRRAR